MAEIRTTVMEIREALGEHEPMLSDWRWSQFVLDRNKAKLKSHSALLAAVAQLLAQVEILEKGLSHFTHRPGMGSMSWYEKEDDTIARSFLERARALEQNSSH